MSIIIKQHKKHRQSGQLAEQAAKDYLLNQGLTFVTANYYTKFGEIDLIMRDHNIIIFVEVRLRNNVKHGHPVETVTSQKQNKLIKSAKYYLLKHNLTDKVFSRFDIITFIGKIENNNVEWFKNVILLEGCGE